jgi:hypothetical protein
MARKRYMRRVNTANIVNTANKNNRAIANKKICSSLNVTNYYSMASAVPAPHLRWKYDKRKYGCTMTRAWQRRGSQAQEKP